MFFKKRTVPEVILMKKYAGFLSDEEIRTISRELSSTKANSKIKTIKRRSDLNRLTKKYDLGIIQGRKKIRWYYNTYITLDDPFGSAIVIAKPKSGFNRSVKIFRYTPNHC